MIKHKENINVLNKLASIGVGLALIVMIIFFSISSSAFVTKSNILNIAYQTSTIIIMSIGMSFIIASGGIDLSVGSTIAFSGVVMAMLMVRGVNYVIAIICGLALGLLIGLINGYIISKAKVAPYIVTLSMQMVCRALALILTQAIPIYGLAKQFRFIGIGKVVGVPVPILLAIVIAIVFFVLLEHTTIGRTTIAIGGSPEASRLSGINIVLSSMKIYALASVLFVIAGIIFAARLNTAEPIAGVGTELDAIASTVLGGTRMGGGYTKISGTIIGALMLGILRNGLTLLNVQTYYQTLTIGIVLVLAVLIDRLRSHQ